MGHFGGAGGQAGQDAEFAPDGDGGGDVESDGGAAEDQSQEFYGYGQPVGHYFGEGVHGGGAQGGEEGDDADVHQDAADEGLEHHSGLAGEGECGPEGGDAQVDGQVDLAQGGRGAAFGAVGEGHSDARGQGGEDGGDGGGDGEDGADNHFGDGVGGADASDGEGEFAHLGHCGADLGGGAGGASGEDAADEVGGHFAGHKDGDDEEGGQDVVVQGAVVDEHTDGDEEEGAEHIADGADQSGDASGGVGVADDDADEEGAGGGGESEELGDESQSEAAAEGGEE